MPRKPKSTKNWAKFPKQIEVNYWRDIRPVVDRIRRLYKEIVEPELKKLLEFEHVEVPETSMDDSVTEKIGRLFRKFRINYYGQEYPLDGDPNTKRFRKKIELQVDKSANSLQRFHKQRFDKNAQFVIGIDPVKREPWLKGYLQDWTAQNVSLIKDIPDIAIDSMERLVAGSVLKGDSQTFLKDEIVRLLGITETRAKRIARDQSGKMYGALTKFRAQFNGWDFYEWSDSGDERVRSIPGTNKQSDHSILNGKIFKFSEPPVTIQRGPRAGTRNGPGQDFNCRCVALVIFDREKFLLFRKQNDGSYAIPKQVAA